MSTVNRDGDLTVVSLSPSEVSFAVCLAAQRLSCKPSYKKWTATNISKYGSHLIGVIGEMAAARVYGGKVNQEIYRSGDRHEPDFIATDGRKMEVKSITYAGDNPMLKIDDDEIIVDDIHFVLAQVVFPDKITIFPAVSVDYVTVHATRKNFGYGLMNVLTAKQILEAHQETLAYI